MISSGIGMFINSGFLERNKPQEMIIQLGIAVVEWIYQL